MSIFEIISLATLTGFVPGVVWLWLWLREDRLHPEPKKRILQAFFAGFLAIIPVLLLQVWSEQFFHDKVIQVTIYAFLEEVFKLLLVYIFVLWRKENNEPVDATIYLITGAIGFAILENILFFIPPLAQSGLSSPEFISTFGNRFLGANLVHIVSSALVGVFFGAAFFKSRTRKVVMVAVGILLATALHTYFNLLILKQSIPSAEQAFLTIWISAFLLLIAIEGIKSIRKRKYV
jgi:protease PrsW